MADVEITIVIPSAVVSRVEAAVNGRLMNSALCEDLGAKNCLKAHLVKQIKQLVKIYEKNLIVQTADDNFEAAYSEPNVS